MYYLSYAEDNHKYVLGPETNIYPNTNFCPEQKLNIINTDFKATTSKTTPKGFLF